jgi:hypothetical protein
MNRSKIGKRERVAEKVEREVLESKKSPSSLEKACKSAFASKPSKGKK